MKFNYWHENELVIIKQNDEKNTSFIFKNLEFWHGIEKTEEVKKEALKLLKSQEFVRLSSTVKENENNLIILD